MSAGKGVSLLPASDCLFQESRAEGGRVLHGEAVRSDGFARVILIQFNINDLGAAEGSCWNLLYKLQKRYHSPAPLVFWSAWIS